MINSIIKNLKVNHYAFKNNKKFKVSKILKKITLIAATTFTLLTTTGCSKDEICEKPITEVVEIVKDNTCFDEVVAQQGFDLSSVNKLEEYTKLAKELHKMDFRRIEIDE